MSILCMISVFYHITYLHKMKLNRYTRNYQSVIFLFLFGNISHKIQKYGRTNHYLLPPGLIQ